MSGIDKAKYLPPHGFFLSIVVMFVLDKLFPIMIFQDTRGIAYLLLAGSFSCILYCAYIFHKNNTNIKPFEESSFLILSWPYTLSRNPIYFCMILFLVGWCLLLQSISSFIVILIFALWIYYRFVLQEEAMLEDKFDEEYLLYKGRVRRWI